MKIQQTVASIDFLVSLSYILFGEMVMGIWIFIKTFTWCKSKFVPISESSALTMLFPMLHIDIKSKR